MSDEKVDTLHGGLHSVLCGHKVELVPLTLVRHKKIYRFKVPLCTNEKCMDEAGEIVALEKKIQWIKRNG